jgi:DNA primase
MLSNEEFAAEAHARLIQSSRAIGYLQKRGIDSSIKRFQLGYAEDGYFANRIIFPIKALDGQVKGFTSRLINEDKTAKSHKHSLRFRMLWFYNENALRHIDYCIICESPIDAITLTQYRLNAMASMGANNLNKGKIQKLTVFKKIYICFDNDLNNAGQKAALRAGQLIADYNPEVYNIGLPFILGPDVNAMHIKLNNEENFKSTFRKCMEEAVKIAGKPKVTRAKLNIKHKTDFNIVELAEKYIDNIQEYGPGYYKMICPFHAETEPSCYLDSYKNRFRCFGCGRNGDTIDFIREIYAKTGNSLTFKKALEILSSP